MHWKMSPCYIFIYHNFRSQIHTIHVTHLVQHQTLPLLSGHLHQVTVIPFVYALDRYGCLDESMTVRSINWWTDNRLSLLLLTTDTTSTVSLYFFVFIIRDKYRCWCYEKLNGKTEGSKSLVHTGLRGGKGDRRIGPTRRDERFHSWKSPDF